MARITQMKDGRTHLAYKAEHVVDLDSNLILAAEIRPADHGDTQTMIALCDALGQRTYIPEPKLKHERTWTDKPAEFQRAVYENRRRMRRMKGRNLQRLRSEWVERSFAHVCDTGGMRRSWLKGKLDVTKRYVIAVAAHNLGRILRKLFRVGKPKCLQGGYGGTSFRGRGPEIQRIA